MGPWATRTFHWPISKSSFSVKTGYAFIRICLRLSIYLIIPLSHNEMPPSFYKMVSAMILFLDIAAVIDYRVSLVRARQKTAPAGVIAMSSSDFFLDSDPPVSGLASPRPVIAPAALRPANRYSPGPWTDAAHRRAHHAW